ncbi:hypothetical protein KY347_05505 [Candidatus Woesearchaeota archaeon]|nr:hypothetical protein [Candidatus Woesearchaeota archaeon]
MGNNKSPLTKSELISQKYPGLAGEYKELLKLKEINEEKLRTVQQYLKSFDEADIKKLSKLFKRVKNLMVKDEKEEAVEKKYALRFFHELRKHKKTGYDKEITELLKSLRSLSHILSKQLGMVYSDQIQWGVKSNFQDFIQLILEEQKIIEGDLKFLDEIKEHFSKQITKDLKENAKRVMIVGHRGARGLYPENTLGSMAKAVECKAQMVEFDVQLCALGTDKKRQVIVMHDYTVDRMTNGHGFIRDLSWDELSKLKIKGINENVPRLEDVIRFLPRWCSMNIELKAHKATKDEIFELGNGVIELIAKYAVPKSRYIISSFNHEMLWIMKQIAGGVRTAALFEDFGASTRLGFEHLVKKGIYNSGGEITKNHYNGVFVKRTLALKAEAVNPPLDMVNKGLIDLAHQNRLKVNVWTVNNPYMMMQLIAWGVDSIITDRPDTLLRIKNSLIRDEIPAFDKMVEKKNL